VGGHANSAEGGRCRYLCPRRLAPAALALGLILVLPLTGCGGGSSDADRSSAALESTFVRAVKRAAPHVVQIETDRGIGSGVVFDGDGHVVTNAHVIRGARRVRVAVADGKRYPASLAGAYPPNDVAVVTATGGGNLEPARFGDSSELHVGDIVLAVGNPLGLRSSVTNGIVSALGRTVSEPGGTVLPDTIQTSAAINPGNSGGALVDLDGRVIGIPTLAAVDPELGGGAAPGIGFAIPSKTVENLARQIVRHGKVVSSGRAYLGVELTTGATGGAIVAAVRAGGPADDAGISPGDAIVSIAGKRTPTPESVAAALATLRPGRSVEVKITHPDGGNATVEVKLGQLPA
jgi:putative serine protease PepD